MVRLLAIVLVLALTPVAADRAPGPAEHAPAPRAPAP